MPGAIEKTTFQRTAPRFACARTEQIELEKIVPIEVAIATCTMCSSGIPA